MHEWLPTHNVTSKQKKKRKQIENYVHIECRDCLSSKFSDLWMVLFTLDITLYPMQMHAV